MSIPMNAECYLCHIKKSVETAQKLGGEAAATAFAKELMQRYIDAPPEKGSPWFGPSVTELLKKHCGVDYDRFAQEKAESNRFVLERMDTIREKIAAAAEPLYAAMQMAVLGNYIDFSALRGEVSFEKLDEMLAQAQDIAVDRENFQAFCKELETGKRFLYITDNAGEIGFDRLFAEEIHKQYPNLAITFCVRGAPIENDATRADAEAVEIPFPVVDNGVGLAGTEVELLRGEAREAFLQADVILSKGQANVETLYGCGYNVYYLFLIKCARFMHYFDKPKLTPMLLRDRDAR